MKKLFAASLVFAVCLGLAGLGLAAVEIDPNKKPAPMKTAEKPAEKAAPVKSAAKPEDKAKSAAKPAAKSEDSAKVAAKGKGKGKGKEVESDNQPADEKALEEASAKFEVFAKDWLVKSNRDMLYNASRKEVTQAGGVYKARYIELDGNTLSIEVKPSGHSHSPFIGTMTYVERTFECEGKTKAEAEKGSFACVKESRVAEIFRYSGNAWKF